MRKKELGPDTIAAVESAIRASLQHARANPAAARAFMQQHAAEMDEAVMDSHVALYVNEYSLDFGPDGIAAIEHLLGLAQKKGSCSRRIPSSVKLQNRVQGLGWKVQ